MDQERKKPTLKGMRSNSVSDSLAKTLIELYGMFFEDSVEILWSIAQATTTKDPKFFDSILIILRDVCSKSTTEAFMRKAIISEVKATAKHQQLFRGRSVAMRMMCAIYKVHGQMYMYQCLTNLFEAAAALDHELKLEKTSTQETYNEFIGIVQPFLDTIWKSVDIFPPLISNIINFSKIISEDRFPGNGAKIALINFVFLRFFSAVVVSPGSFGFEPPKPISQHGNVFLMNLSKGLSLLANSLFTEIQDSPFTPIIKENSEKCMAFLQEISTEKPDNSTEAKIMTLPDGSPIVPKHVRDALKDILNDIETNYPRIVWTLKDFSFIADKIYGILKIKGVKQLKTPKAILQEPDPTMTTTKVDEKFLDINADDYAREPPKEPPKEPPTESPRTPTPEPTKKPSDDFLPSKEDMVHFSNAHKQLDEILICYAKSTHERIEAMQKEVDEEHAARVRAEQDILVLQREKEALNKKIEMLKMKISSMEQQNKQLQNRIQFQQKQQTHPNTTDNNQFVPPPLQPTSFSSFTPPQNGPLTPMLQSPPTTALSSLTPSSESSGTSSAQAITTKTAVGTTQVQQTGFHVAGVHRDSSQRSSFQLGMLRTMKQNQQQPQQAQRKGSQWPPGPPPFFQQN